MSLGLYLALTVGNPVLGGGVRAPTISGGTEVGDTLTLDPGSYAGGAIQWYRADPLTVGGDPITHNGSIIYINPEIITGQTGLTYLLAEIDNDMIIFARIDDEVDTEATGPITDPRYGPELLLNPRMDSDTVWTDNDFSTGVSTIADGIMELVSSGSFATRGERRQQWTAEVSTVYRIRVDAVSGVGAAWGRSIVFDSGATQASTELQFNGSSALSQAVNYTALTTTPSLFIRGYTGTLRVTSASVREVL